MGGGVRFCLFWRGSAMEDACWTLPRSCASGVPTLRGKDAGPTAADPAACRCCGLWPCIRWTWARTFRATRSEPNSGGWLHRIRAARRPVQRPAWASCRRNVSKFADATRSAWTTGSRLNRADGVPRGPRRRAYPTAIPLERAASPLGASHGT